MRSDFYMDDRIKKYREAIKPSWVDLRNIKLVKGERPLKFKQAKANQEIINLKDTFPNIKQKTLTECIKNRRSLRKYQDKALSFEEMSYILYETARIDSYAENRVFRTIPTGGATNGMETYIYINRVDDIKQGLYHYIQDKGVLALIDDSIDSKERFNLALMKQLRDAPITIILTTVPARSEYRYSFCAHKMLAMEAGHAGQNVSLAAEVIDCGACAIAAYDQDLLDKFLQVDGCEEFAMYALTVGKK